MLVGFQKDNIVYIACVNGMGAFLSRVKVAARISALVSLWLASEDRWDVRYLLMW